MSHLDDMPATTRRVASRDDAVDDVVPSEVAAPDSPVGLQSVMADATSRQEHVIFTGNRTKISWGLPPRAFDLAVDTSALPRILDHEASDLVVRVSSNITLEELQETLAEKDQRLAIDTMVGHTTIGGLISTGISGPLRYGFGAVRDLVIGITVVRSDGVLASSGGRVVKNVAGYDLAKLFTGSYGTLGAVTEAFFRLHALPEASIFVVATLPRSEVRGAISTVLHSQVGASAVEIHATSGSSSITLGILIEGEEQSVRTRATTIRQALGGSTEVLDDPPMWWGALVGDTTFKISIEIAQLSTVLDAINILGQRHGVDLTVTGSAGVGVLFVGCDTDEATSNRVVEELAGDIRHIASRSGGSSITLRAPLHLRTTHDVWGPIPALAVMNRIKSQFDPLQLLAPGRFVGEI